jgi:hypothetical protein
MSKYNDDASIIRAKSNIPVFMVDRAIAQDTRLSFAARGLYVYLLSINDAQAQYAAVAEHENTPEYLELVNAGLIDEYEVGS